MGTILFLVESPHKAETLTHILGKQYKIMATVGHMMDLDPSNMSVDIKNNFAPIYINNKDKLEVISKIKAAANKADSIIFASDPDREGEMIAWGAAKILGVKNPQRVTYTEITKSAILEAVKHPRDIDMDLVDAQKTRRILDRIVGYEISPLLVKVLAIQHLSAGRVQSVVARLIVDKEREISEFMNKELPAIFKFTGDFKSGSDILHSTLYNISVDNKQKTAKKKTDKNDEDDSSDIEQENGMTKIPSLNTAQNLMARFCKSTFIVGDIDEKILTRNPSPPFSTSSMQQASANKLGFTVKRTMSAAQNLYEGGYITYLRTDSVNLSNEAIINIGKFIVDKFGKEYHRQTQYKSKSKNTQEAHEAIRPTDVTIIDGLTGKKIGNDEIKLYSLIWKRAVASQMSQAKIKQNKIHIKVDNEKTYEFISKSELVQFAGFLKVYNIDDVENNPDDVVNTIKHLPHTGDKLDIVNITGKQSYQKPPARYSDGTLVNKMKPENLNIGRPATTQSIITKIQERGYVRKGDVDGVEKKITIFQINKKRIVETSTETVMFGKEVNRFIPTDLGMKVNDFLMNYFPDIMDYQFTSEMEEKLDDIAEGKIKWLKVMKDFYKDFHPTVEKIKEESKEIVKKNKKILGNYPETDQPIEVSLAKFGPVVKMKKDKKYVYAPIQLPLTMENITLEDAIKLLEYPKNLGQYDGKDILLQKGKFGYYLKFNGENIAIGDNSNVSLGDAIAAIKKKDDKYLWTGKDDKFTYRILDGKFGKYIMAVPTAKLKRKLNVKLPSDIDLKKLTLVDVQKLVSEWKPHRKYKKKSKTDE